MSGPVMTPTAMNSANSISNTAKTSSNSARCSSSDSTGEDSLSDDDSNPQQGTAISNKGVGPPANAPLESVGGPAPSPNGNPVLPTTPATNGNATNSAHPPRRQNSGSRDTSASSSPSKFPPTVKDIRKLFVGGLPSDVTSEEFRQFFEQYGTVLDSVVMFDRITTRSRGFGFVTFEDYAVGQQLVKLGHVPMRNNKLVEIKPAEPKGSPNMNQNHPTSSRYHRPSPPYHPSHGRGNFVGVVPVIPATTTTTVSILGETTTTTGMDNSTSTAWASTIPVATTPSRVTFPPPFYPSPTMMMNHNSVTETTTILNANGGGMCMDMPSAPPFMMPYPMYQSYEGTYPSGIGPTSAPPLYSAPLYDMYAAPGYTASFMYETAPMAPGTPTSYEAPWVNSNVAEGSATPSDENDVDRSS